MSATSPTAAQLPDWHQRLGPVLRFMRALWEVDHALFSASKRMKARIGVTGPERLVIRIVGELPDVTPTELAEIMHVDPSTLTGLLQRLVRRRVLSRRPDPNDARKSHLRLTAQGQTIDRLRSGTVEEAVRTALDGLTPADVAATVSVLGTLSRVLAATSRGGAAAPVRAVDRTRRRRRRERG